MKALFILLLITLSTCESIEKVSQETTHAVTVIQTEKPVIEYSEFNPEKITDFELEGFDIDAAFKLDAACILSAYAEGDLALSDKPTNWGDRLVMYCNNEIKFQSKPVGDPYLYAPHFYKNETNNTVIIICQLGFEYYFGGDAFLLQNGKIQSIGQLEIEGDDPELSLTDIVLIHEVDEEIHFNFKSDSLYYKPGYDDIKIGNNNVHYTFKNDSLELKGM